MTLNAQIKARLALVPGQLGELWSYRTMTSAPGVEPRVWSAWTTGVGAVFSHQGSSEQYMQDMRTVRLHKGSLRVAESISTDEGAQWRAPDGLTIWAVVGIDSGDNGTVRYSLVRELPLVVQPDRGGVL